MTKYLSTLLVCLSLILSSGCVKEQPKTIEEKAMAEVQSFYDALNDGFILTHIYKSDFIKDKDFLNQAINVAAYNFDEDIYNQLVITLKNLSALAETQAYNIALFYVNEKSEFDSEENDLYSRPPTQKEKQEIIMVEQLIKNIAALSLQIADTKFEDLHKHNAFEYLISKLDKPASELFKTSIAYFGYFPKSINDILITKVNEQNVMIIFKKDPDLPLFLELEDNKWKLFDSSEEQICFAYDLDEKKEILSEIASSLRIDTSDRDAQIDKAKMIQTLKLFDESIDPIVNEKDPERFAESFALFIGTFFSIFM